MSSKRAASDRAEPLRVPERCSRVRCHATRSCRAAEQAPAASSAAIHRMPQTSVHFLRSRPRQWTCQTIVATVDTRRNNMNWKQILVANCAHRQSWMTSLRAMTRRLAAACQTASPPTPCSGTAHGKQNDCDQQHPSQEKIKHIVNNFESRTSALLVGDGVEQASVERLQQRRHNLDANARQHLRVTQRLIQSLQLHCNNELSKPALSDDSKAN